MIGRSELSDAPPLGAPAIRVIAMPADTNPAGDIFGGWLMSQMDLAAGSVAIRASRGRYATVSVDRFQFRRPVRVGDEVSIHAELERTGRSSMTIAVEAWRRARDEEASERFTRATFVFLALDSEGRSARRCTGAGGGQDNNDINRIEQLLVVQ